MSRGIFSPDHDEIRLSMVVCFYLFLGSVSQRTFLIPALSLIPLKQSTHTPLYDACLTHHARGVATRSPLRSPSSARNT